MKSHLPWVAAAALLAITPACGDDGDDGGEDQDVTADVVQDVEGDVPVGDVPDDVEPDVPDEDVADVDDAEDTADVADVDDAVDVADGDDADAGPTVPSPPALGAQIDRVGRPGITTALIGTLAEQPAKGEAKDDYNEALMPAWPPFAPDIAANLAIYDGLDGTCGNQLLAGDTAEAGRYDVLAGALADDRLFVDSSSTACTTYLAVEADAVGLLANDDCGGRMPAFDVIDATYSALAVGAFSGVGDGVDADDGVVTGDFPFLAPHQAATPPPPELGLQIDRVGRPGITTALIGTLAEQPAKGDAKDDYNEALMPAWPPFAADIAANLAIYDGLDGTCGNQLLAGDTAEAGRYDVLAGALADDRLFVDSSSTTCTTYLAVEADAVGLLPNDDCGGRMPAFDVIDATYSALAVGAFSGVGDGVDADDGAVMGTFPFLDEAP